MVFANLRASVALLLELGEITDPLTTATGLRDYIGWAIKMAEAFNVPPQLVASLGNVANDTKAFTELLAVVCYSHSAMNAQASAALPDGIDVVETSDKQQLQVTTQQLVKWLPLASQLITFVNDINRMAGRHG